MFRAALTTTLRAGVPTPASASRMGKLLRH